MGKRLTTGVLALSIGAGALVGFLWQDDKTRERVTFEQDVPKYESVEEERELFDKEPIYVTVKDPPKTEHQDQKISIQKGDVTWRKCQQVYNIVLNGEIIGCIRRVVDRNSPEYPHLLLDTKRVVNGVVENAPDGIPADVIYPGDVYVFERAPVTVVNERQEFAGYKDVPKVPRQFEKVKSQNFLGYEHVRETTTDTIPIFPGQNPYYALTGLIGACAGIGVAGMATVPFYIRRKRLEKYLASPEAQVLIKMLYAPIVVGGLTKAIS